MGNLAATVIQGYHKLKTERHPIVAVDIGAEETRFGVMNNDDTEIIEVPSVVTIDSYTEEVIAYGNESRAELGLNIPGHKVIELAEKTPVDNLDYTTEFLKRCFEEELHINTFFQRPEVVVSYPVAGMETPFYRNSLIEAIERSVNLKSVTPVYEPIASAVGTNHDIDHDIVGTGYDILDNAVVLIVDVGGRKTEVAAVSSSGVIEDVYALTGEMTLANDIRSYLKDERNLYVSTKQALELLRTMGCASPNMYSGRRRQAATGKYKLGDLAEITVLPRDIKRAISQSPRNIYNKIKELITDLFFGIKGDRENIVPELTEHAVIIGYTQGLRGIDKILEKEVNIHFITPKDPARTTVIGLMEIAQNQEKYKHLMN